MSTIPSYTPPATPPISAKLNPDEASLPPSPFDELPVPVIDCNVQGIITAINHSAQELMRVHGISLLGNELWLIVAPDERQASRDAFFALMADGTGEPQPVRRSIYTTNGGFRTYQVNRCFLRDARNQLVGLRMTMTDVTEFATAYEREKTSRLWLESISESLSEAVVVTDTLGFIRFANLATAHLTEWEQSELVHMTISKAIPILSYSRVDGIPFNYRLVLERHSSGIITFLTKNKQQVTVAFSTAPVLDRVQGSTIGVSYVFHKPDMPL